MATQLIMLNGGSSSGKSGISRCLQAVLPEPWLATGIDRLIESMPASMRASDVGIELAPDGGVAVGADGCSGLHSGQRHRLFCWRVSTRQLRFKVDLKYIKALRFAADVPNILRVVQRLLYNVNEVERFRRYVIDSRVAMRRLSQGAAINLARQAEW